VFGASLVLALGASAPGTLLAQSPPAAPAQATAPAAGQTAGQRFKNVQVLKDVPAEQLPLAMQYITASLGVRCDFCHVTGPGGAFDKDDKETKGRAREMMKMVAAINDGQFEGRQTVGCMSCHNGHMRPTRTPLLAEEMTPEEAAVARASREAGPGGAGPGAQRGAGSPGPAGAPGGRQAGPDGGRQGGPAAAGGNGGNGGRPPRPTETLDEVLAKYQQALGGKDALARGTTRTVTGTITTRDLQTSNFTAKETAAGAYRIDIASQPNPTIRVVDGASGWTSGGFNNMVRDLDGLQLQQTARLADFGLPLHLQERYQAAAVTRYGNIDGKPTIIVSGRPSPGVTEQLQFDRETGLLLRRSVSTGTPLGPLPEQIDYSDYRDVNGVKVPFTVRHSTWNAVTTEKLSQVTFNTPIAKEEFAKPAGK
jgi:hypothetical protein